MAKITKLTAKTLTAEIRKRLSTISGRIVVANIKALLDEADESSATLAKVILLDQVIPLLPRIHTGTAYSVKVANEIEELIVLYYSQKAKDSSARKAEKAEKTAKMKAVREEAKAAKAAKILAEKALKGTTPKFEEVTDEIIDDTSTEETSEKLSETSTEGTSTEDNSSITQE